MTGTWKIALFAGLAERLGTRYLEPDWPEEQMTAGQLKTKLMERYPAHAADIAPCFVACNQAFARDEASVRREDELALLPPVSGGSDGKHSEDIGGGERYAIVTQPIDAAAVLRLIAHPDHGANIAFIGTTREWTQGKRTVSLEYEAYEPMALAMMRQIGEEIAARWSGTRTAITHRIGPVGIGEASVVIAVSSPHRAACYEASRYAIDRLKQTVPIWKKEVYEDGSEWKGYGPGPWNPVESDTL